MGQGASRLQRRHVILAGILWAVLTAIGWLLVVADLYPTVGSDEAEDFDDIFRFLLILGVPVFTFVVSAVMMGVLDRLSFAAHREH